MLRRNSENKIWKQIPFLGWFLSWSFQTLTISELVSYKPVWRSDLGLSLPNHVWFTQTVSFIPTCPRFSYLLVIVVLVGGNSTVSTSRKCHLSCYHCSNLRTQELQFILFIPFALYLLSFILHRSNFRRRQLRCTQEARFILQTRAK